MPVDDGACDHLEGMAVPALELESSVGPVDLAAFGAERGVLYVYPRTGRPGPADARRAGTRSPARAAARRSRAGSATTPRSCAGSARSVAGLSAQTLEEQVELSERLGILYPVIADPELRLRDALGLPTFEFEGATLYKRVTLVFERGRIAKVFYPVFPPDRNAEEVVAWLAS